MAEGTSITEESGATPIDATATPKQSPRSHLDRVRRALLDEELTSPAAVRFLIADNDRLQERTTELDATVKDFNDLRVKCAGLEEKTKKSTATEILVTTAVAVGGFGLGQGQRLIGIVEVRDVGFVIMIGCALLIVAGLIAKAWK